MRCIRPFNNPFRRCSTWKAFAHPFRLPRYKLIPTKDLPFPNLHRPFQQPTLIFPNKIAPFAGCVPALFHCFVDGNVAEGFRVCPTSERPRLSNASVLVAVDAVDGTVELVAEAEVGYALTSLDEIGIKHPSLKPLRGCLKAIAVNLHGNSFLLGVNDERGKSAALGKMRMDERGRTAALKMKTPRSYSEVPL